MEDRARRAIPSEREVSSDARRLAGCLYHNMMAFVQGAVSTMVELRGQETAKLVLEEMHRLIHEQDWNLEDDQPRRD
jgi:hypothetical protein